MKKTILSMVCAIILGVTCFAPLNVNAYFIKPTSTVVQLYDQDGRKMNQCTLGGDTVACGTTWTSQRGFEQYNVAMNLKVPNHYTVEIYMQTSIKGIAMSTENPPSFETYYSSNGDLVALGHQFVKAEEHWIGSESQSIVTSVINFTNNTGSELQQMIFSYKNFGGNNSANYTLFTMPFLFINIYDEHGRLIETVQDGYELLHEDLKNTNTALDNIKSTINTVNTSILNLHDYLASKLSEYFSNLYANLNQNFNNLFSVLRQELDKVVKAIQGDGHSVTTQDEMQEQSEDLTMLQQIESEVFSEFFESSFQSFSDFELNNDIFSNNDFLMTSQFISTQMTNIYESNYIFKMLITFGLVLGLAFTVIGISVKR